MSSQPKLGTKKSNDSIENGEGEEEERNENEVYNQHNDNSVFGIDIPWGLTYFLSPEGSEYFHIYLWIAKDLSWTQNNFLFAMLFGGCAIIWCPVLAYNAIKYKKYLELYMLIATVLWLTGNFVWMHGETLTQDDDVDVKQSSIILGTAIGWLMFYYLIVRPLNLLPPETQLFYVEVLNPRYPVNLFFKNWRDYEHVHMLFWCCKDLSWNQEWVVFWWFSTCATLLVSIDFIITTWNTTNHFVDTVHYFCLFLWVLGNAAWAYGGIYEPDGEDDTYAFSIWSFDHIQHFRWWSSWILVINMVIIVTFNLVWIFITYFSFSDQDYVNLEEADWLQQDDQHQESSKEDENSTKIEDIDKSHRSKSGGQTNKSSTKNHKGYNTNSIDKSNFDDTFLSLVNSKDTPLIRQNQT